MKKLFLLPFVAILGVALIGYYFYQNSLAANPKDASFKSFVIQKGESATTVGSNLKSAGLIKSPVSFKLYLQFTGQAGKIKTGEFRLSPSFNLFQTVTTLSRGPIEIWVTIPEGLRREEIAVKFETGLDRNQSFVDEFLISSKGKEGYLFPDTYLFPRDASASAIVAKMRSTFDSKTLNLNLTSQDVILASLIERETKTSEERPIVAGILLNRIFIGMPLQVDASVQYAIGNPYDWWPILTRDDLGVNSPFNTYKFTGFPPAPIANPGISSLEAAASPSQSDYLYYIHDPSGQIHYAKTLAEHNDNIAKYLTK